MQHQDLLDWLEESGLPPDTTPEKYYVEAQDSGYGLSFLPYNVQDKKATRKRRKKIQQGDEKAWTVRGEENVACYAAHPIPDNQKSRLKLYNTTDW